METSSIPQHLRCPLLQEHGETTSANPSASESLILEVKSGCVCPYSLSFFEQLDAEEDKALEEGKSAGEKEPRPLSDSMEQSLSAPSPSVHLHWAMM